MNVLGTLILIAVCSPVAAGAVAQSGLPTNEQLRHDRSIADPRLSPDGKSVLVTIADSTADGFKTDIWVIYTDGAPPRQLTYSSDNDKTGEHAAEWMPDGHSILFLAHRGEHTSLYRLPMNGGEAKAFDLRVAPAVDRSKEPDAIPREVLDAAARNKDDAEKDSAEPAATASVAIPSVPPKAGESKNRLAVDVGGYTVAPDGRSIALRIDDPQTAGEKHLVDVKADAEWVDQNSHRSRLYLLDPSQNELKPTAAPTDVRGATWSPDSTRLLVLSEVPGHVSDLHPAMSVAIVKRAQPDEIEALPKLPATISAAEWSKDGLHIVYIAQAIQDAPPGVGDLYDYSLASGTSVNRTRNLPFSLANAVPLTLKDGEIDQLVESGPDVVLARFASTSTEDRPLLLRLPVAAIHAVHTNQGQTGWVFIGDDGGHPTSLYFSERQTEVPRTLPLPPLYPPSLMTEAATLAPKRLHWKSDRFTIEGLLYLPPAASSHKVPLVVEVHGGPTGSFSDSFDPFTRFLLGQGWAVLRPNPRGSTGYGAAFAAANKNDLGGGDFRDIMAGVDFILATEQVDANRMALIGYSYGGEMAGFAESRTDRFKAIVSGAPVTNQFSEYGTERDSFYDRWFYGYPWHHLQDVWRQSPLAGLYRAGNAPLRTPFLLLQGESDNTDPLGQSQEMYRALRQAGVPVDLVTYPREDHAPLANGIYGNACIEGGQGF